jgi:hypothetical protein
VNPSDGDALNPRAGVELPPDVRAALDPRRQMGHTGRILFAVRGAPHTAARVVEGFLGHRRYAVYVILLALLAAIKLTRIDDQLITLIDVAR